MLTVPLVAIAPLGRRESEGRTGERQRCKLREARRVQHYHNKMWQKHGGLVPWPAGLDGHKVEKAGVYN